MGLLEFVDVKPSRTYVEVTQKPIGEIMVAATHSVMASGPDTGGPQTAKYQVEAVSWAETVLSSPPVNSYGVRFDIRKYDASPESEPLFQFSLALDGAHELGEWLVKKVAQLKS
jgi:hypothetical protein